MAVSQITAMARFFLAVSMAVWLLPVAAGMGSLSIKVVSLGTQARAHLPIQQTLVDQLDQLRRLVGRSQRGV